MLGYFIEKAYFKRVDTIELWGKTYTSYYDRNYYYNKNDNILILEAYHENWNYMAYTLITKNKELYLGDIDIGWFNDDSESIIKIYNKIY